MSDYKAAKAFQEVLVPVMNDEGEFIADMTLTDNLVCHKQILIDTLKAVKSGLSVKQLDLGLQTYHVPEDKPDTLICRDGMLDSTRVASFAFKVGQMLTEKETMAFVSYVLTPDRFRIEPEKRILPEPTPNKS